MLVSTIVSNVKRLAQYGDPSVTNDTITSDIIGFLNNRMYKMWRAWPWDWGLVPISFSTVIGQTDYSIIGQNDAVGVLSNVGGILALTVGSGGYLKVLTWKRYLDWFLQNQIDTTTGLATVPANGNVTHYVRIGRDANGNIKIRLWRPPSSVVTITGFGKTRIVPHTVADIAAGVAINYFPAETHDVLQEGLLSDVYEEANQKQMSIEKDKKFNDGIEELKSDGSDNQDFDPTTPPPDMWLWKHRSRGGTTVVVLACSIFLAKMIFLWHGMA